LPPKLILDLGSTKSDIVAAMEALPAGFDPVGGHPMCGKELSGAAAAEAGLYRGQTFILTPLARTSAGALNLAHQLVAAVGARPLAMTAARQDALVAQISHLPYVAAVALMRAAQAIGDEQVWEVAASGFRDTSRLAGSDLTMMLDILLTNREAVAKALAGYRAELERLACLVDQGEAEALRAALEPARAKRSELFGTTSLTPAPLPKGEGSTALTPTPVSKGEGSTALTPTPSPKGEGNTALAPTPSPKGEGNTALTPTPSPKGEGNTGFSPTPLPKGEGSTGLSPTPLPKGEGSTALTPTPSPKGEGR
jgi:hypothetical protein